MASIARGNWRFRTGEIARAAGCDPSLVSHHFGSLRLLYRVIAREHTDDVLRSLGLEPLDDDRTADAQCDFVWIVMTGERRPRP